MPDPKRKPVTEAQRIALREAMERVLDRNERLAILMFHSDGLNAFEIARVLNMQPLKAMTLLLRAKRKLREAYRRIVPLVPKLER